MIELTQEQWQAIAQQEHPTLIEPESRTEYVIVPKNEFDQHRTSEAEAARILRLTWMRRMGLDQDEISDSLRGEPPTSVEEEMKQIRALDNLDKITPPAEVLRKFAVKYY